VLALRWAVDGDCGEGLLFILDVLAQCFVVPTLNLFAVGCGSEGSGVIEEFVD